MIHEIDYDTLDPGIRFTVRRLRDAGFETTDSGDGVSKPHESCVMEFPHVAAVVAPSEMIAEAERMQSVLGEEWHVEASYSTADKAAVLLAACGALSAALAVYAVPSRPEPPTAGLAERLNMFFMTNRSWCGAAFPDHPNKAFGGCYNYCPRCGLKADVHAVAEAIAALRAGRPEPPANLLGVISKCKFCGAEIAYDPCEFGDWMDRETVHACARGANKEKPHTPKRVSDEQ